MKGLLIKNAACIFLLVLLITGCFGNKNANQRFSGENMNNTEVSNHFAIFIVRGVRTADAIKSELIDLPLEPQPLFTDKDLKSYKWKEHKLELRKDYDLNKSLEKVPLDGLPFVVMANDKRIYLGAFWSPLSSSTSSVPWIMVMPPTIPQQNKLTIQAGYPDKLNRPQIDPRNNQIVYDALKSAGKIKE